MRFGIRTRFIQTMQKYNLYPSIPATASPASSWEQLSTLTPEQIQEIQEFFPMPKFFVFGHARSGTTLLARLLRCHPAVHCDWQSRFFTMDPGIGHLLAHDAVQKWAEHPSNSWTTGQNMPPAIVRVACDFLMERAAHQAGKQVVGDKTPNHNAGEAVRRAHKIYPDARIIFIVRDCRDAILSHRFVTLIDFADNLSDEDRRIRERLIASGGASIGKESLFPGDSLADAVKNWAENARETHHVAQELYGDHYHTLRYDDLLADPVTVMTAAWQFLGVETDQPELAATVQQEMTQNPQAARQKTNAPEIAALLKRGTAGAWREFFTPEDQRIVSQYAGAELSQWGY